MFRIREIRQKKGMTLMELSKASGLSFMCIQTLETHGGNPTIGTLERIATALGTDVAHLLCG